jgi:hypothetical protein
MVTTGFSAQQTQITGQRLLFLYKEVLHKPLPNID